VAEPTLEATWLREHWHPDDQHLGPLRNKWIAVMKGGEVIRSDDDFDSLFAMTSSMNPLYAFVFFGDLQ